ncbi:hypothetical protein V6N12_043653 [Hibiscus sabdariffa]|uniref:BAH domain-containing protein n=1 Tax=Hibiscus sabdariffa TaxID=183260 RepID=A0ABR2DEZ3_9ROSI
MGGLAVVATTASPSSGTTAYVSWEEVNVSSDKGRREVHYYLKRRDGVSDLAVIGREKSLRHMSYHFAIKNRSLFFSSTSFYKLKSRREVVYWLNSVVSDSYSRGSYCSVDGIGNGKTVKTMDFGAVKQDLQSQNFVQYSKEVLWLGFSWTCKRKRKHYRSFSRNGIIISVHNFVYVLAEEDKRLVAYLEDLYEDSRGNKMVVVRWFHKIDEVDVELSHNYNCREIFFSPCLQDISIECIDGLATVLSPVHFKKLLNEAKHTLLEPFVCCKQFENDDIEPFDVTQLKGYWKQDILRHMHSLSPLNDCVANQNRVNDDQKPVWDVDDGVGIRPRKRYRQSKDDDVLHLNFSGSRELMETSRADLQDLQNIKKGNESFSFQVDEVKQSSSQHLIVGSQVEVLTQDSGMRGCWLRAQIIKKHKNKVKVQYQDVQDAADEVNKLEEWILASKVVAPDEVGVRISGRTTIRPPSQYTKGNSSCIGVGSVVDVWWHDGWWEGLVVRKDQEAKFVVHFPGEKRELVFDIGDIRQSQEWVGNRWINMKERCDLVSTMLQVGRQDVSNSYDCTFDTNTICDGGRSGKDVSDDNDSPGEPAGNDTAKDESLVPDLAKDDWLSQLKWKSSGKRKRVTSTRVRKLNCSRNLVKSTARSVSSERFLIPASLKVDNDNCKYIGDALFSSSVVPPLTSLVMTSQAPKKETRRPHLNNPKSFLLPGTSLASVESLSMPLVQEVVISADIGCSACQKKIADIISRMNADTDSVLVNLLENKVTLTCTYPKLASTQVPVVYRKPVSTMAIIKRFFRTSRR